MAVTSTLSRESREVEPPRILVVQPDRSYLSVISRRLIDGGYRVAAAICASSALAELHRMPIDLILSDLRMPKVGGAELVRIVRDDPVHRNIPFFMITGRSDAAGAVVAYRSGADTVIAKPFHFEVLIARIAREIERARSLGRLLHDNAALDARVIGRAIELGEMREQWLETEAELRRLKQIVGEA
jgi:PleD family two-component response regulator